MKLRGTSAVIVASLALAAVPAVAGAQSAGDDQYVDPLNGVSGERSPGGSGAGSAGDGSGMAGSGPSGATGSGSQLPAELARTGAELPAAAGAGLLLLAAGLGLRRFSGARG